MVKIFCPYCEEYNEFKQCGFERYNERLECTNCQSVKLSWFSRVFGKYRNYKKWFTRNEWKKELDSSFFVFYEVV